MKINDIAARLGKTTDELTLILKSNNIEVTGETTLRTIAEQMGISPHDLYALLAGK